MGNTHWTDYVIFLFMFCSAVCLAIVGARKTFKYGYLKGAIQELDSFDKKLLKLSGLFLMIFLILLVVRLML